MLCEILGWRKAKSAVPDLIVCMNDKSASVRAEAAQALAKIGAASAGQAMMNRLEQEKDEGVRQMLLIALGAIGYQRAQTILTSALLESDPVTRGAAAWSLGTMHIKRARTALNAALINETSSFARERIQEALRLIVANTA
jgi:HEAT repeat protein